MPRAKIPEQSIYPYHITGRCINKEWFSVSMEVVWEIMSRELRFLTYAYDVKIHSFVLMSNHFHLLATTPQANLSVAMWNFMKQSSFSLTSAGNRINQTYGQRYFRSVVMSEHYFMHAYKYVYANPLKAGFVDKVENYRFSTLHGLLGYERLQIPIVEDTLLFQDINHTLNWLNRKVSQENWNSVKFALEKREFKLARNKDNKKPSCLEIDTL
jgi:putative transposase